MKREEEEKDNQNLKERIDLDANPLTSFGRENVFTDELIKGICEKNETVSPATKESTSNSNLQKKHEKPDGNATFRKKRNTRKKKGIR